MSKRVTLTNFEKKQIVNALKNLQRQTTLDYCVIECGKDFYQQIIDKLDLPEEPEEA